MNILLEEKLILSEIEKQYQTLITLLTELRCMCKLNWYQAAKILHCDGTSLHRYEKYDQTMRLDKFVQYCYYYMLYIREHNIPYTPKAVKAIKECWIPISSPMPEK